MRTIISKCNFSSYINTRLRIVFILIIFPFLVINGDLWGQQQNAYDEKEVLIESGFPYKQENTPNIINDYGKDFDFFSITVNGVIINKTRNAVEAFTESERINVEKVDFPEFVDTGNKRKDEKLYQTKKEEWVNSNPEKYQNMLKEE